MENNLLSLRTYSLSYQHIYSENRVQRLNLVHELEDMFDKECKIVIVEGKEGSGKTDILLQFSKKHCFDAITFFVNPAYRASYRQDYFMEDVGRQILFFNKNEIPGEDLEITEGIFNKLAFDLTTSPGRKNKPVYFILDGLDQIEKSDFELLKNGLQNLPWNTNNFYFLVSGTIEKLKEIFPQLWLKNFKSLRIPRFTENETKQLFNLDDSASSHRFLREIHDTWKGHPDSLSQVRRIINSGITIEEFLDKFDISEKNELLEIEWKQANLEGLTLVAPEILVISILAFDDNIRNIQRISSIVALSVTELLTVVAKVSFLSVNEGNISFVSNSYRQYAVYKLKRFEKETNAKLIDFYTQSDDINSILNLPTLFNKNSEWGNIVDLLTVDNLDLIISNSRSFSEIKKQINYGYKAAQRLISNLDTDPARKRMSEPANDYFEKLDLEKTAESDYSQIGKIKDRREKGNFAWNLLSQLNSQKRKSREIGETVSFLHSSSTMPFFYSVPLYQFFIENLIKSEDKDNLLLSLYEAANSNAKLCYNLICNISNKNSSALSYSISSSTNSIVIAPGMYKQAIDFIKNYINGTGTKEIFLIDPYFSSKDMGFLKNLDDWCYNSTTTVLTSIESWGDFNENIYLEAWEKHSSDAPPLNRFIRVKTQNNKSPFHDRYIILHDKKIGLRMGGSINGLNGNKTFEISKMLATEVDAIYETVVKPLVYQRLKEYQNHTIRYESFDF
ncbi:MAG: hypothetical protein V4577_09455 [Bacteroidota bacterium]